MRKGDFSRLVLLSAVLGTLSAARAQAPELIHYQGRLVGGTNLVNGTVGLSLRLWMGPFSLPFAQPLYEDSNTVTVVDGLYSTFIGDDPASPAFANAFVNNSNLWVEVAVNGVTLSPRERVTSVAYALATRGLRMATNGSVALNPAENSVAAASVRSAIGGGQNNNIQGAVTGGTIAGGIGNTLQNGADKGFIGGGTGNKIQPLGTVNAIAGGYQNSIGDGAYASFIGGGDGNFIGTNASHAVIPGGRANAVGEGANASFAGGTRAKANHPGSFVWADSTDADLATTANDQFLIRAAGGVGIGTNATAGQALTVAGNVNIKGTTTVAVIAGNGALITNLSAAAIAPPLNLTYSSTTGSVVFANNIGGGPAVWAEATNATAVAAINWGAGNALFVANGGTGPSAILLGGNVGVGTQSPAEKFSVNGTIYSSSGGYKFPDDSVLATATNLLDKTVGGTVSGPVNFSNAANTFAGKFAGDGAGLTNISVENLSPGGAISWKGFPKVDGADSFIEGQSFALGDVNGDGWTDAVGGTFFGDFRTYLNNTSGYLAWTYTSNLSWNIQQVALGDFNGDGRLDAAAIDSYYRAVFVLTNNGNGLFTRVSSNSVPFSGYRLVSEDITGDGRPDLIAGSDWSANIITVYTNNGSGGFVSNATYQIGTRGGALTCVDLTGDGRRDLIIGSSFTNAFTILTNRGTGAFFSNATFNVGSISIGNGSIGLVTAADLNNDGKLDLATIGGGTNLLVYTNNGTGGFTALPAQPQSAYGLFVTALKANDDGWTDLAVEINAGFYLLLNNGSGVFSNTGTTASSSSGCQMGAADMNGDGNADLVRLDYRDAMEVFLNTVAFVGKFSGSFSGDGSELTSAAGWYRYYDNPYNITYTYNRVGIGMASPTNALDVNGNVGAYNYYFLSDSRQKENFAEVDHETVLEKISAMKVSQWNYKHEPGVLHIGPMAQDFHSAFGLGPNDVSISTSDEGGVALAAIQALNAKLERENAELKKRLDDLAKRLQALEAK